MADYEGMRWFKCDFQVQTPENAAHLADADTKLSAARRPMAVPVPDAQGHASPAKPDEHRLVATHNANLPVTADAEQIYAVEARVRAQGGLDIMEGSEQAFKQRSEKHHF